MFIMLKYLREFFLIIASYILQLVSENEEDCFNGICCGGRFFLIFATVEKIKDSRKNYETLTCFKKMLSILLGKVSALNLIGGLRYVFV